MKRNIILLLIINLSLFVCAKQRTLNEVYQLAQNFFTQSEQISTRMSASPCLIASSSDFQQKMNTRSFQSEENAFYIFNNDSHGFVIISADDRMSPILAYSDTGPFILDNIPNYIVEYLLSYLAELEYINESDGNISEDMITSYIEIEEGINSMEPSSSFIMSNKTLPSTIAPLLGTIKWGQGAPFNELCPIINGTVQALTGCVATAMAQIMKYYQYPTKGIGSKTYTTETQNITCSFDFENTSFDYSLMLPQYIEDEYASEQATEVAKLMSACGVAVSMNYKTSASGAYASNIPQAMIDYFNYDSDMYYLKREYFLYDEWMELIKSELSEGRPVMYSGIATGGHQFIFDGYDSDNLVHVNWGWSGKNDGYFMVTKLQSSNPGVEGEVFTNTGYTNNQAMIVGIRPAQDIPSTDNKTLLYCERITDRKSVV